VYRRWEVHTASEFGKGLVRRGSAFLREREGEAAFPKAENARGNRNGRNIEA